MRYFPHLGAGPGPKGKGEINLGHFKAVKEALGTTTESANRCCTCPPRSELGENIFMVAAPVNHGPKKCGALCYFIPESALKRAGLTPEQFLAMDLD